MRYRQGKDAEEGEGAMLPPHIETQLIHGAYEPEQVTGATALPIFQSTAFAYETAEEIEAVFAGRDAGYTYTRIGNPTLDRLERRIADLEGGLAAVSCSSGMAAITATVLGLAGSGDEIVSADSIFGGTYSLFCKTLTRFGVKTRFAASTDVQAYRDAITDRTKLIFVETIGNPGLDVPDLAEIAEVAQRQDVVLVVDNTVTTPVLIRPAALGANIVIHSTSKFINGHGNSIGGMVVDCGNFDWTHPRYQHLEPFHKRFRKFAFVASLRNQICRDMGFTLSPFNAFLTSVGIESLGVRMERHCSNASRLAEFLSKDPRVEQVRYPGLATHPDHAVALRQFQGRFGGILTLRLGAKERCFRFINGLRLAQNLANMGDTKTLVIHPASTFCRELDDQERHAMGATDDLVRISVGLEHVDDIIEDISQSLERI